jgi:hypothetical protein
MDNWMHRGAFPLSSFSRIPPQSFLVTFFQLLGMPHSMTTYFNGAGHPIFTWAKNLIDGNQVYVNFLEFYEVFSLSFSIRDPFVLLLRSIGSSVVLNFFLFLHFA